MAIPSVQVESTEGRFKRYQAAVSRRQLWQSQMDQAYRWLAPNRLPLIEDDRPFGILSDSRTRGEERNDHIFDPTGEESVLSFANNMQLNLMPPNKEWASVVVSDGIENLPQIYHERFGPITSETIISIKKQLQEINKIMFTHFESSKLYSSINESFQDLAITLGAILINEGNLDNPIIYDAIPANTIVLESDVENQITNVWRPITLAGRLIKEKWPNATIPPTLQEKINKAPEVPHSLIEGTITYPNNPTGKQFYYFVMLADGTVDLLTEWVDYFPWLIFRGQKSPGETYGRGPGLTALPYVRQLNKLSEYVLRGMQMQAFPVFVLSNGMSDINPYTFSIEPGAIIESNPGIKPSDTIQSVSGASPEVPFQYIQFMQNAVKEIMFANPINVQNKANTATEAQIINNNWVQKNAGFFSRTSIELFPGLIDKTLHILTKKGAIPKLDINGKKVTVRIDNILLKLDYMSPLTKAIRMQEVQDIEQGVQFALQTFGGVEGLLTMNIGQLPEEVYERLDLPTELINYKFKNSPLVKRIQDAVNGQQQGSPAQPEVFSNTQQPSPQ